MAAIFAPFILLLSSLVLYSTKLDRVRVVTIQKPIVITQERKTPAYFAYQQGKLLGTKKPIVNSAQSRFLANFSVQPPAPRFQLAELKLTRSEYAQYYYSQFRVRSIANNIQEEMSRLAYEKVVFNPTTETPRVDAADDTPALSPARKWATIRGKFELRDGVGIVDHRIEIKRVEEGTVREVGRIDLQAGSYAIDIESPNGVLVAQIHDKAGLIIGEDRQRLINLQNRGNYLEGPFIRVGMPETLAAAPGFSAGSDYKSGTAVAAAGSKVASYNAKSTRPNVAVTIFDNQKTLASPEEEFVNISKYANTIARFFDPARTFANSVSIRMTGDSSETPLFTKKWLDGVVSYISDSMKIQFNSEKTAVLIGRILVDGKPAAGAIAAVESLPGIRPMYLDQFLMPSVGLTATGPNGLFVFVGMQEQIYNVAALMNGKVIGSQLFVAEPDSVSFQNIQTVGIPMSLAIRSFDAFSSTPLETDILASFQEEPISFTAEGGSLLSYVQNNVSEFVVYPTTPEYRETRFFQSGKRDYVHASLISEDWLKKTREAQGIQEFSGHGMIVGFTPSVKSAAYLVLENYSQSNIVYFNQVGQIVGAPVAGGGFILFNVPPGAREVILQDAATERIYSQVFNVIPHVISATQFSD